MFFGGLGPSKLVQDLATVADLAPPCAPCMYLETPWAEYSARGPLRHFKCPTANITPEGVFLPEMLF